MGCGVWSPQDPGQLSLCSQAILINKTWCWQRRAAGHRAGDTPTLPDPGRGGGHTLIADWRTRTDNAGSSRGFPEHSTVERYEYDETFRSQWNVSMKFWVKVVWVCGCVDWLCCVQMFPLSLPNDLHIKSCRFPVVNLPRGTGRTCTAWHRRHHNTGPHSQHTTLQ